MKPPPFAYTDPDSLAEALDTLEQFGDEGKVLAGGQSLVPLLNMRLASPEVIVDLNRIDELSFVRPTARGGIPGFSIGAMTRQSTIAASEQLRSSVPLLAEGIAWVGHPQIRNRGTFGGSIAHADPAAELPLVFRVLDGVATAQSSAGCREIDAANFFEYTFTPALEASEILTEIWLPTAGPRTGYAFLEVARRHGDFALVAAAVVLTLDEHGTVEDVRIGLGGAASTPMRADSAERMMRGQRAGLPLFRDAGREAAAQADPSGDIHADAEYRREVAGTLTFRALTRAFERSRKDDA